MEDGFNDSSYDEDIDERLSEEIAEANLFVIVFPCHILSKAQLINLTIPLCFSSKTIIASLIRIISLNFLSNSPCIISALPSSFTLTEPIVDSSVWAI